MKNDKYAGKKCFVIMPFGKKKDVDGTEVDFDYVYHNLIEKAVEDLGVECERCDEIVGSEMIHKKMFRGIFDADVAVVDITSLNPNVFYELGVRHALHKHVTVVIRKNSTLPIPFNISVQSILGYSMDSDEALRTSRRRIRGLIQNGLDNQITDSIVHDVLTDLKVDRKYKMLDTKEITLYSLVKEPAKKIGIITGDIQNIDEVDVWVNSENTNMQMARHYERSISGTIRFMGAEKDVAKRVTRDVIADELNEIVGKCSVDPGTVIPTTAGELTKTNHVKKIFHAASVRGQVGRGYSSIPDIDECVRNALELADSDEMQKAGIRSILFPLMGTGTSRLAAESVARDLIGAAIYHMEENKDSKINKVLFLAFNERDRQICEYTYSTFIREGRLRKGVIQRANDKVPAPTRKVRKTNK